jgi:hypothetical protein
LNLNHPCSQKAKKENKGAREKNLRGFPCLSILLLLDNVFTVSFYPLVSSRVRFHHTIKFKANVESYGESILAMETFKTDFSVTHIGDHMKIVASDKPIINETITDLDKRNPTGVADEGNASMYTTAQVYNSVGR